MARRAELLDQFAHLQLLKRCAASCRRGVRCLGSLPTHSENLRRQLPLATAAAVSAAVHVCILSAQSKVSPLHSPTTHILSLALSAALTQTTTDPTTSNPQPKTPTHPHQPTKGSTQSSRCEASDKDVNKRGAFSKREVDT